MNIDDLIKFQNAISEDYITQFFIEDLPAYDTLGWMKDTKYLLKTHINFNIFYDPDTNKLIHANISLPFFEDYTEIN
jgi:hypothetical protein